MGNKIPIGEQKAYLHDDIIKQIKDAQNNTNEHNRRKEKERERVQQGGAGGGGYRVDMDVATVNTYLVAAFNDIKLLIEA